VGAHLRIVPNHSCLAAAGYDRYYVVRGEQVVDEWRPVKGW
jgi:D-serine deaminase-like pyridoxal phosphate-dependent protein